MGNASISLNGGAQEAVLGARNRLTTKLPPNKERKIIDTTYGLAITVLSDRSHPLKICARDNLCYRERPPDQKCERFLTLPKLTNVEISLDALILLFA